MDETIRKIALMGLGIAVLTKEKAEQFAEELVKKGEMNEDESREFVKDLVKKSEEQTVELEKRIREEVRKASTKLNYATKADLQKLEKKIAKPKAKPAKKKKKR